MPSVLKNLGNLHIVTGTITGGDTLTSNDASATLTDNDTGDWTVTFGQVFMSTPIVVASVIDATFATTAHHTVAVVASATNSVQFNAITKGTATTTALADIDISFMAIGKRNN